jgi:hypothetical protein
MASDEECPDKANVASEHVHVSLWGFKNCPWVSPESVAEALESLPMHLLTGLRNIRYEPVPLAPGMYSWVTAPAQSRLHGLYSQEDRTILVQGVKNRVDLFRVLFHELGHHIYFSVLLSEEKKHWVVNLWGSEDAVSSYGKRNAAEDFAELFSLFLMGSSKLHDRPVKTRFLRDTVLRNAHFKSQLLRDVVYQKASQKA